LNTVIGILVTVCLLNTVIAIFVTVRHVCSVHFYTRVGISCLRKR
jgi:hypothetical protein